MKKEATLYVGFNKEGKWETVVVNREEHKKEVAKTVAQMIRDGLEIKLIPMNEWPKVRDNHV